MKRKYLISMSFLLLLSWCWNNLHGQTRLVLNGAKINIRNNAFLVIENPSPDAIRRDSGYIISEGENNNIKWMTGINTGTYQIPLGYGDTTYLPVNFTKSAGTGNGYFLFSSYHTGWQNSLDQPQDISDLLTSGNDNSNFILDRFWKIDAVDYTTKPDLSNLVFHYPEYEFNVADNVIIESQMGAYRWNDVSSTWFDFVPSETIDIAGNSLTVANVAADDLYKWWVMADKVSVLPSHIYNFRASRSGLNVKILWSIDYDAEVLTFDIERSSNGREFYKIGTDGRVPLNTTNHYTFVDDSPVNGINFYRIRQLRIDHSKEYTAIRMVDMSKNAAIKIYPNPSQNRMVTVDMKTTPQGDYSISLTDLNGKICYSGHFKNPGGLVNIDFGPGLNAGVYVIKINRAGFSKMIKIILL